MFAVRNFHQGVQVLLAACDSDLLGTKHEEGKLRLDVAPSFYDGVRVEEEELRSYLGACTVANLVGPKTVAVAISLGVVDEQHVMHIGGVPHAQMVML